MKGLPSGKSNIFFPKICCWRLKNTPFFSQRFLILLIILFSLFPKGSQSSEPFFQRFSIIHKGFHHFDKVPVGLQAFLLGPCVVLMPGGHWVDLQSFFQGFLADVCIVIYQVCAPQMLGPLCFPQGPHLSPTTLM